MTMQLERTVVTLGPVSRPEMAVLVGTYVLASGATPADYSRAPIDCPYCHQLLVKVHPRVGAARIAQVTKRLNQQQVSALMERVPDDLTTLICVPCQ